MSILKEQDSVVWYVLKRPLVRPNTSYTKAAFCVSLFLAANCGGSILLHYLLWWLDISSFLPEFIDRLYTEHHLVFSASLSSSLFLISGAFSLKPALIGAIRLYQRYAPERLRRKCLFKPTCSEYAILVIMKYGVIRGLYKSYIRLFKKCRGRVYRIDEP